MTRTFARVWPRGNKKPGHRKRDDRAKLWF
jgi:hypothetical protein